MEERRPLVRVNEGTAEIGRRRVTSPRVGSGRTAVVERVGGAAGAGDGENQSSRCLVGSHSASISTSPQDEKRIPVTW